MLSCKEVSELASRSLDQSLPLGRRIAMRLHLFACEGCRRYLEQLRFLRRATRRLSEDMDRGHPHEETLSPEAKERMRDEIERHS